MASFRVPLFFLLSCLLFSIVLVASPASSISDRRAPWKKEGLHGHNLIPRRARSLIAEAPYSAQAPSPAKSKSPKLDSNSTTTSPSPSPSSSASSPSSKKKPLWVRWLAGIALGVVSGIISAIIVSTLFHFIHDWIIKGKPNKPVVFQRNVDVKSLAFLEKDDAFDNLEVLGKGGSGEVYKATIKIKSPLKQGEKNDKVVAIKKVLCIANVNTKQGVDSSLEKSYDLTKNSAQIRAEMDTLGHVRHRNLVTLLAYVPKPNAHVLVYDFMENGSLHDILGRVREGTLALPWPMRFNIAKGVANGLKYLHFDAKPTIIHRDLKPANILLDEKMDAHIGDFGLAKVMPDAMTHFTSNNLAGTVGYIAPEYHQTLKYTSRGDVYSFGVVLVVLITGRQPNDTMFSEVYTHMGTWVNMVLGDRNQTLNVIDPSLHGEGFEEQMLLIFKIASFCLQDNPSARPSSNDIVKMFDQVENPNRGTPLQNAVPPSPPPQQSTTSPS